MYNQQGHGGTYLVFCKGQHVLLGKIDMQQGRF